MSSASRPPQKSSGWLRPRDQASVAVLTAGATMMIAAYWWVHNGHRGELIDIDRAPPLAAKFQVDVNRAEWPELIQLPDIGPVLAQRLVADREEHGEFLSVDDLMRIRGIGPRTLERIRPYVQPIAGQHDIAKR